MCYFRFRYMCIPSISSALVKPASIRFIISCWVVAALLVHSSSVVVSSACAMFM